MKKGKKKSVSKKTKKVSKTRTIKKTSKPKAHKKVKKSKETLPFAQFAIGIIFILIAALFMFLDIVHLSFRIAIGVVGIILIATAPFSPLNYSKDK